MIAGGEDGRLEADADAREHDGRRAGERGAGDVLRRTLVGAGVVAGEPEDDAGEDDADDDREERREARVAGEGVDLLVARAELGVGRGQVGVGRDGRQDRRDDGRDVEAAVDGAQRVLARAGLGDVDAEERGDRTDRRDDEREDQAVLAEGHRAEDERGDEGDGVGLEEVGRHAGAVADVVTDVVGDRRGVARVVLGDAGLDLADEVGADVGGLGEDATADAHEHREEGGAEAEALEDLGGVALVEQDDDRGAEQAQAHGRHADGAAGAERDPHAVVAAVLVPGGRGDADVGLDGQAHAEVADRGRRRRHRGRRSRSVPIGCRRCRRAAAGGDRRRAPRRSRAS